MNPYNFVRVDWAAGVRRQPPKPHNRFEGFSGRLQGEIKTLTPLFIPKSKTEGFGNQAREFITNGQRIPIIPGTTLKGLVRNLVETIGAGCWWLRGKSHARQLPSAFHQCSRDNLCVACRMFGLINGGSLLLGHVGFEDAICVQPKMHVPIYTLILSGPKDRHTAFYLDSQQQYLAGRKFYYHHSSPIKTATDWLPSHNVSPDKRQNQYIKPMGVDTVFTFSAHFNNLSLTELQLLLYALVLEPTMRHKIGQAKPAGLGSVEISLTQLELIDYSQRYAAAATNRGKTTYIGAALAAYLTQQTQPYVGNHTSNTLNDLRQIWGWPGRDDLSYPSQDWFKNNALVTLNQM